ncbi:hypothetical protein AYO38_03215 [bacterium SCGC AG-212-C10]|nr:hypothetical protein AYO38_03215 [bacterium SCGC AG-212-C10]
MRLEISYRTRYAYDPPVARGLSALRVRPGLKVLEASLRCSPGRVSSTYTDAWGTTVDIVEFDRLHAVSQFEMRATVETCLQERDDPPTEDEWYLYRHDSPRVRSVAVEPLAWTVGNEGGAWQAVESALAWIPQRFAYQVGATDAETTIEEVIGIGSGVCQDFAHVFLALLRRWGWCARYVSGYLFSTSREADRIEAEAMHAWVEVYRPGAGWVGLDATSGMLADDRYVAVARGRDYDDVRPVRGIINGKGRQTQESRLEILHTAHLSQQQQQ